LEPEADVQATWLRRIHEEDRQRVADSVQEAIEKRQRQWQETYRFIHSDGHEVPVTHRGSVIVDQDKRPVRFAGGLVVLSDADRVDPRLQKMASRLSKQLDTVQRLSMSASDTDNNLYRLISSSAQSLLDADGSALSLIQGDHFAYVSAIGIGGSRQSAMVPIKNSMAEEALEKAQTIVLNNVAAYARWDAEAWRESGVQSAMITILSGSTRPLAVLKVLSRKANAFSEEDVQSLELFAQTASAILERRQLEAQLRNSQRLQSLGQLTGGIAHDFNNLLQAIQGYSEFLVVGMDPKNPASDSLKEIDKAGHRGKRLISQLLAFSRRQVLRPVDLNLSEVIATSLKMIQGLIGEHIQLDFISGHGLGVVHADRGLAEQVLMNLCVNARDAMPSGGTLTIETEGILIDHEYAQHHSWAIEGHCILLSVSDTGVGMDQKTLERIFEPFF
ncbi:MAG: PAS domain-containing protein, partial [Oricola sp.]|nr:PAS domain-containing protein [Oricola sp.]